MTNLIALKKEYATAKRKLINLEADPDANPMSIEFYENAARKLIVLITKIERGQ